jgi:hypothetical protein
MAAVGAADVAMAASVADAKPHHSKQNLQESAWGSSGVFFVDRPGGSKKHVAGDPSQGETTPGKTETVGESPARLKAIWNAVSVNKAPKIQGSSDETKSSLRDSARPCSRTRRQTCSSAWASSSAGSAFCGVSRPEEFRVLGLKPAFFRRRFFLPNNDLKFRQAVRTKGCSGNKWPPFPPAG